MEQIRIRDLMNQVPVTVGRDADLLAITGRMRERECSCVVVIDEKTAPIGIVTERDLVRHLGRVLEDGAPPDGLAGDIMTSPVISALDDATMFEALVLTQTRKIRHLPVVNEAGEVCGVLTYTDLARAYHRVIEVQRQAIDRAVTERTSDLEAANRKLLEMSMEDPLMSIGNRRAMEVDVAYTHGASVRYRRPYSIVLFDVDRFKQYNDHYGHQAGDRALALVSQHLRRMIRNSDRLYRYGGEEILLLLPETPLSGAMTLANRAIADLKALAIPHSKSEFGVLTISAGVASPDEQQRPGSAGWHKVLADADASLYRSKQLGRNQASTVVPEIPDTVGERSLTLH